MWESSALFGGGANAFSKYERGEVMQSAAMDRLLRIVNRYPVLMAELAAPPEEPIRPVVGGTGEYGRGAPIRLRNPGTPLRAQATQGRVIGKLAEWKRDRVS